MPIVVKIIRDGSHFSAKADDEKSFYVGLKTDYEGNVGLVNIFSGTKIQKLNFKALDYEGVYGFWSHFIEPTALCEGRNFLTLNTYDSAAFTFGFGQFAAHVADGDFVTYLREMLKLPEAHDYFPHLGLVDGRIHRVEFGTPPIPLETAATSAPLMRYLNPTSDDIEDSEVIAAAKLIHWTARSETARNAQVRQMTETYRTFMKRADHRVGIDGRPARECCVIADILHHGRGGKNTTWPRIDEALKKADAFAALLKIGLPKWEDRLETLRTAIGARPAFATLKWSRQAGGFV